MSISAKSVLESAVETTLGFKGVEGRPAIHAKARLIALQVNSELIKATERSLAEELSNNSEARRTVIAALQFVILRTMVPDIIPPQNIARFWVIAKDHKNYSAFVETHLGLTEVFAPKTGNQLILSVKKARDLAKAFFPDHYDEEIWH